MKGKKRSAPQSVRHRAPKTTLSAPSNASLEIRLPFQEFQKLAGTLTEIVGPRDLDTLNSALHHLFIFLREASRQFYEEGDGGRSAAFYALAGYWMFVTAFRTALIENLQVPILTLQDALAGLNNNAVAPILRPVPRRGRSPSNVMHAVMRGHAAATVTRLMEIGFGRDEALREVAKVLSQIGIRPERGSGVVKAGTVRNWCNEVSSDIGRHGEAARQYDYWITRRQEHEKNSEMPKDARARYALAALTAWVNPPFRRLSPPVISRQSPSASDLETRNDSFDHKVARQ